MLPNFKNLVNRDELFLWVGVVRVSGTLFKLLIRYLSSFVVDMVELVMELGNLGSVVDSCLTLRE